METDDPFASLGGLGSGLGANFGPRTAPFRSQSFNVGSGHGSGPGGKKDKVQDPAVEHDLYVSLDDINKVRTEVLRDGKLESWLDLYLGLPQQLFTIRWGFKESYFKKSLSFSAQGLFQLHSRYGVKYSQQH